MSAKCHKQTCRIEYPSRKNPGTFAPGVLVAKFQKVLMPGAACHGSSRAGEGPYARFLNVPIPSLTTLSKMNSGVFPIRRCMKLLMEGWCCRLMARETCPFGAKSLATRNALSILIPKPSCVPKLMRWCCTSPASELGCRRSRLAADLRQKRKFCLVHATSALPPNSGHSLWRAQCPLCSSGHYLLFLKARQIAN